MAAEASDRFRGVFAMGPVASIRDYGDASCVSDMALAREARLRSPIEYIERTLSRTFIIEGADSPSNAHVLPLFHRYQGTAPIDIVEVPGLTHFSVLAPATEVVARAIVDDQGAESRIAMHAEQIVEAASERCGVSRLEESETSEPAPWAIRSPTEWPQIVLTNDASFVERTPLSGASAFLLEGADGEAFVATARHLTSWPGGVEPPVDDAALALPARFARQLDQWRVFPRTHPDVLGVVAGLSEPAVFGDWLLLTVQTRPPESVTALRLAGEPVAVGDRVYLVGCPYAEPRCAQNVYQGRVTRRGRDRFWYDIDPPVEVRGFSGAPILSSSGRVVGVFSVSEDLEETPDGLQVEGEANDRLVRHVAACRGNPPLARPTRLEAGARGA